ncbi:MAG: sigma 54-interacting transcriptional regulator [Acidobacteriota bacterium]
MTLSSSRANPDCLPRKRDRRVGIVELLASLARALNTRTDPTTLRTVFEEALRRLVSARSVHLRDGPGGWARSEDGGILLETFAFDVPAGDGGSPGVLEATFDRGKGVCDWDVQLLTGAAHVGTLLLEIERSRTRLTGVSSAPKARRDGAAPLIGSTPTMQTLRSKIERVAGTDFTVLLEGESGVGKELVARQVHDLSRRRHGPFVAVNCAALVDTLLEAELFGIEERTATGVKGRRGKFEHADGGTLFLDEVSDLSLAAQAKLLRAIQDLTVERVGGHAARRIDTRIVAATNRPLHPLVERQLFRADLYYRLSGVDIRVPALRERRADVLELAHYFLGRHRATRSLRLSVAATDALAAYDWPGNVRQLERLMERAVALAETDVLELDDLPLTVRGDYATTLAPSLERRETLRTWASRYARLVLDRTKGNKRAACRVLDISYHTLQAYLRHRIDDGPESYSAANGEEGDSSGGSESSRDSVLEV